MDSDLDLRKLRYFIAVAETLHFGRAATELRIAQPVLSRQIRALEDGVGARLLSRDRRSVELTRAGEQLLADARPLVAAAAAVRQRLSRSAALEGEPAGLVVGFGWGMAVTDIVSAFAEACPGAGVTVRHLDWAGQAEAVRGGRVDIALVRPPVPEEGLLINLLGTEPRVVALPRGHRLAERSAVCCADLVGERILAGADPLPGSVRVVSGSLPMTDPAIPVEERLELVAGGYGLTLLPESAASCYHRPGVSYARVTDAPPEEIWLVRPASGSTPLAAAFAKVAQRVRLR